MAGAGLFVVHVADNFSKCCKSRNARRNSVDYVRFCGDFSDDFDRFCRATHAWIKEKIIPQNVKALLKKISQNDKIEIWKRLSLILKKVSR